MDPGAFSVVGAALIQQRRLEIVANNLANASTIGYKADVPLFRVGKEVGGAEVRPSLLQRAITQPAWERTHIDFRQGPLKKTGNPLDLALQGPGFFVLQTRNGIQYTRSGEFSLNAEGVLVSKEGATVLDDTGAPIQLDRSPATPGGIIVNQEGEVHVGGELAGRIGVVRFSRPEVLEKRGRANFVPGRPGVPEPEPVETPVMQGFLEESNTGAINEMAKLIEMARLYETYQKFLQSFDEASDRAVNDLGHTREVQ